MSYNVGDRIQEDGKKGTIVAIHSKGTVDVMFDHLDFPKRRQEHSVRRLNPSRKAEIQQMINTAPPAWKEMFRRYKLGNKPSVDKLIETVLEYTPSMRKYGDRGDADHTPPPKVRDEAMKGIVLSHRHNYTSKSGIGLVRAMQLVVKPKIWDRSVQRMSSYFERHDKDQNARNFGNDNKPSRGYMAWLNWGGDSGKTWADNIMNRYSVSVNPRRRRNMRIGGGIVPLEDKRESAIKEFMKKLYAEEGISVYPFEPDDYEKRLFWITNQIGSLPTREIDKQVVKYWFDRYDGTLQGKEINFRRGQNANPRRNKAAKDAAGRFIPAKYLKGFTGKKREERIKELGQRRQEYADALEKYGDEDDFPRSVSKKLYRPFKTDKGVKSKRSSYTQAARDRGFTGSLADKAEAASAYYGGKIPVRILKEVKSRGMAAWASGGHRPGQTSHSWGEARVNSFLVGGKAFFTSDNKLARELPKKVYNAIEEERVWKGNPSFGIALNYHSNPYSEDEISYTELDLPHRSNEMAIIYRNNKGTRRTKDALVPWMADRIPQEGKLTKAERASLPKSAFVFPSRAPGSGSYPIPNLAYAKLALNMASWTEKGREAIPEILPIVLKKYPQLKKWKHIDRYYDIAKDPDAHWGGDEVQWHMAGRIAANPQKFQPTFHVGSHKSYSVELKPIQGGRGYEIEVKESLPMHRVGGFGGGYHSQISRKKYKTKAEAKKEAKKLLALIRSDHQHGAAWRAKLNPRRNPWSHVSERGTFVRPYRPGVTETSGLRSSLQEVYEWIEYLEADKDAITRMTLWRLDQLYHNITLLIDNYFFIVADKEVRDLKKIERQVARELRKRRGTELFPVPESSVYDEHRKSNPRSYQRRSNMAYSKYGVAELKQKYRDEYGPKWFEDSQVMAEYKRRRKALRDKGIAASKQAKPQAKKRAAPAKRTAAKGKILLDVVEEIKPRSVVTNQREYAPSTTVWISDCGMSIDAMKAGKVKYGAVKVTARAAKDAGVLVFKTKALAVKFGPKNTASLSRKRKQSNPRRRASRKKLHTWNTFRTANAGKYTPKKLSAAWKRYKRANRIK